LNVIIRFIILQENYKYYKSYNNIQENMIKFYGGSNFKHDKYFLTNPLAIVKNDTPKTDIPNYRFQNYITASQTKFEATRIKFVN